jgi:cobyrinic acid a,c-diamide synthase
VAQDNAFNFYYQDNLDLLTQLGAELVPFSPIKDAALPPNLAGLYIGGGFPEVFAAELAANATLRREILEKLNAGLPAYAECGGLMYLGRSLIDETGREHEMTGFFPHTTAMTKRLQNFGYVELTFAADTVLGPRNTKVKAHEFHHSAIVGNEPDYVINIQKSPTRSWRGGLAKNNVLAAYPHIHFQANPALAEHFIERCREFGG